MVTFKMTSRVQKGSFSYVNCERCLIQIYTWTASKYPLYSRISLLGKTQVWKIQRHPPLNVVDPEMTICTLSFMKNVPILFKFTHELHFSIHYQIPGSVYLEKFCVKFEKSSHPPLNAIDPEMTIFTHSNMKNVSILFKFSRAAF